MSKAHKRKILWILLFSAALIFYVRTVPQVSLSERAIVVGLGIDYEAEKGYTLTAQIINPIKQGQTGGASDSYGIVDATADTLAVAIGLISEKTGLTVSLSQCNVLILGKSLLQTDIFPSVNYLVQTFQIPEQAILSATDTTAGELLRAKPVLTSISSFYLQQTLTTLEENETVLTTDIKDFAGKYLAENGAPTMAFITLRDLPAEDSGGQTAESGGQEKYTEFQYEKSVIFSEGKLPFVLSADDTESINFVLHKLKEGGETVVVDGRTYTVTLTNKKYSDKAELIDGRLRYKAKLKMKYYVSEVKNLGGYVSVEDIPDETIGKIEAAVKAQIEEKILATYDKCKAGGYDVYGIYGAAYAAEGVKWKKIAAANYFDIIDFIINADVKVTRK